MNAKMGLSLVTPAALFVTGAMVRVMLRVMKRAGPAFLLAAVFCPAPATADTVDFDRDILATHSDRRVSQPRDKSLDINKRHAHEHIGRNRRCVGGKRARERIDLQPQLIGRQHLLPLHLDRQDALIDPHDLVDERHAQDDARAGLSKGFARAIAVDDIFGVAEANDHALLGFRHDRDRAADDDQQDHHGGLDQPVAQVVSHGFGLSGAEGQGPARGSSPARAVR